MYYNAPRYTLALIAPPTVEPITLEEAMSQLNIDLDDRHLDGWLTSNIPAAREWCEGWLGSTLAPQTLEIGYGGQSPATTVPAYWQTEYLNPWVADSHYIALPYGPVSEVVSVIYHDAAGDEQTIPPADYVLAGDLLLLASGASWPAVSASYNAIAIRYIAGYTLPEDALPKPLPKALHSAILLALTFLESGAAEVNAENAAKSYMERYRLRLGMA